MLFPGPEMWIKFVYRSGREREREKEREREREREKFCTGISNGLDGLAGGWMEGHRFFVLCQREKEREREIERETERERERERERSSPEVF
jgi:hypothetical protein